jgi:hypothetical protein
VEFLRELTRVTEIGWAHAVAQELAEDGNAARIQQTAAAEQSGKLAKLVGVGNDGTAVRCRPPATRRSFGDHQQALESIRNRSAEPW